MTTPNRPGRKPDPPAERRTRWLHVRVRPDEARAIITAAGETNVSQWARTTLLAAAEEKSGEAETAQGIDS